MKYVLITLLFSLVFIMTTPAHAGYKYYKWDRYKSYHYSYYYNSNRHKRHRDRYGAYLLGGVIIGSLLTRSTYDNRSRDSNNRVVYRDGPQAGRVLIRDKRGYCYLMINRNGAQIRTLTDWGACN